MAQYAIINLEDKLDDDSGQRGAADSTVKGLRQRYERIKGNSGVAKLFLGNNKVTEYRCVTADPLGFVQDPNQLARIRTACAGAAKIYVIAHGDPRTPDVCYTNSPGGVGVVQLATRQQLAGFLATVLPANLESRTIALVMCYGARCRNYKSAQVNHMGMVAQDDLRTSFAYGLFYHLVHDHHRSFRLTAVTGKIQHMADSGRALVEHEEMIDFNMAFAEAARAQTQAKKAWDRFRQLQPNTDPGDFYQTELGTAARQATKDAQLAKSAQARAVMDRGQYEEMGKYGKFVYEFSQGSLKIGSKYGDPNNTNMGAGTVLYSGQLLAPA